jgi:hypothetical protein
MNYRDDFREVEKQAYWSAPRVLLASICLIAALAVVGFIATGADFAAFRFWAPKYENAKRVVFENTQSYVQGKAEYIGRLRYQYANADPGPQKEALRTLILSEAATVDVSKLPTDEQGFLNSIGGAR